MVGIGREECSNLWKMIILLAFLAVLVFFSKSLGRLMSGLYQNCMKWKESHMQLRVQLIFFCVILWLRLAERSVQSCEKWSFFGVFSRLGLFPQVFGQVKEWLMFKLHKIIRVSDVVAYPIVFVLFYERVWQGGIFIVMKTDHFLVVCKFLERWGSNLY